MQKRTLYHNHIGAQLHDIILGGQDGIVNVLGLVLGVASATASTHLVLIAALASLFAESISMGAVAYTSSNAAHSYYLSELQRTEQSIQKNPTQEKKEIRTLYAKKGFRGKELNLLVQKITSNKKIWLNTILDEKLHLSPKEYNHPAHIGIVVGIATLIGSFIPLLPFFLPIHTATKVAFITCLFVLFIVGAIQAKLTIGDWKRKGIEMATIGILAALAGYFIGKIVGTVPI